MAEYLFELLLLLLNIYLIYPGYKNFYLLTTTIESLELHFVGRIKDVLFIIFVRRIKVVLFNNFDYYTIYINLNFIWILFSSTCSFLPSFLLFSFVSFGSAYPPERKNILSMQTLFKKKSSEID